SLVKSFQSDTWTPSLVQCDGTERFGGLKAFDLRVAAAPSYGEQRQHQRLQVPARLATATRLRNRNGLMPLLPHLRREKLTQRFQQRARCLRSLVHRLSRHGRFLHLGMVAHLPVCQETAISAAPTKSAAEARSRCNRRCSKRLSSLDTAVW